MGCAYRKEWDGNPLWQDFGGEGGKGLLQLLGMKMESLSSMMQIARHC